MIINNLKLIYFIVTNKNKSFSLKNNNNMLTLDGNIWANFDRKNFNNPYF